MAEVEPADVDLIAAGNTAAIVPIITAMAKAYTRNNGFDDYGEPNDAIAAVITTAAVRFLGNPAQTVGVQTAGPFTLDRRSSFTGWTLAELFVLNRYRKRAQ